MYHGLKHYVWNMMMQVMLVCPVESYNPFPDKWYKINESEGCFLRHVILWEHTLCLNLKMTNANSHSGTCDREDDFKSNFLSPILKLTLRVVWNVNVFKVFNHYILTSTESPECSFTGIVQTFLDDTYSHPITGFKDDSACVTTKTAGRIAEDGLVVLNIIYMVYNIFHALTLWSVHFLYITWIVYQI